MSARTPDTSVAHPDVASLLVASCYPCHASPRTVPWYGRLAPSSWPGSARTVLDLTELASYDPERRAAAMNAIAATVSGGSMPPADYMFFDRSAKLTAEERHRLAEWAHAQAVAISTR